MLTKSKHIGIVACSVEGAALCLREIAAYSLNFMGEHLYPKIFKKVEMKISCPEEKEQKIVDEIIFKELVNGIVSEASRLRYNEVIDRMKARGFDNVILGCTEIPLLVRADDCPLPALNSTRLLARAAVDAALQIG